MNTISRVYQLRSFYFLGFITTFFVLLSPAQAQTPSPSTLVFLPFISKIDKTEPPGNTVPTISDITTNLTDYPNNQVPTYEKVELTFQDPEGFN